MVEKRKLCPQELNTGSPAIYPKAHSEGTLIKKLCDIK
jgi:hypothetical protein